MYIKIKLRKPFQQKILKFIIWGISITFAFFLLGIIIAVGLFIGLSNNLPSAEELKNISFNQSTQIYDRNGKLLYTVHGEENRQYVPLSEISRHLINATLAMEDQHFYDHYGFYPKRILGAIYYRLIATITGSKQKIAGASTITQQFAKNAFLTPERSITRKLKELILAIRLERYYDKDEILEMYLNKIPYGNNGYGAERAAQIYFNKKAKDLTLAESAILAALPQAPSRYNPYGQYRHSLITKEFDLNELKKRDIKSEKDLDSSEIARGLIGKVIELGNGAKVYIRGRTDLVLRIMSEQGSITEQDKQKAWEESQKIEFHKFKESITAPHFVLYVKQILEERYGKEMVENGGMRVFTTLDLDIQKLAEESVLNRADYIEKQYGATNAGLLALDPKTGHILAMVGSKDYQNEKIQGNVNIVTRKRQPGSSFKPIVYAQVLLKKYSPASIVYDLETKFDGGEPPRNFDGRFEGPITIRRALAQSRNIPAIKMYFLGGGEKEIIPLAEKMGIKSLNQNFNYGWPLALGAGELTMLELASAYAVFANTGIKKPVIPFLKITNAEGKIFEEWQDQKGEEVLNPQVAFLINSILSDRNNSLGAKLHIEDYQNAAKTGTSNRRLSKDKILPNNTWVFNYTPRIVVAGWAGNNDGSPMKINANGYDAVAPIVKDFMTKLFQQRKEDFPSEDFVIPEGIEKITVSKASGKLPSPLNPKDMLITDYFANFAKPTETDHSFEEASIDISTNEIATAFCPPELVQKKVFRKHEDIDPSYQKWQDAVMAWAYSNQEWSHQLPQQSCHIHNETTFKNIPTLKILSPSANDTVPKGFLEIKVSTIANNGVDRVEFFLNGKLQYTAKDSPYNGSVRIPKNADPGKEYKIAVNIFDTLQYKTSTEISIFVKDELSESLTDEIFEEIEEVTTTEKIF